MSEVEEVAYRTRDLLLRAGWKGRPLSWRAARAIAKLLHPDEGEVYRDNLAEALRRLR